MLLAFDSFLASPTFFWALIIWKYVHIQNVKLLEIIFKIFSINYSAFSSFLINEITKFSMVVFPLLLKILNFHNSFNIVFMDVICISLNICSVFLNLFIFNKLLLNVVTFPIAFQLLKFLIGQLKTILNFEIKYLSSFHLYFQLQTWFYIFQNITSKLHSSLMSLLMVNRIQVNKIWVKVFFIFTRNLFCYF